MCEESETVKAVVSSEAKVVVSTNAAGDAARENGGRQEEIGGGAVSKSAMGEDAKLGDSMRAWAESEQRCQG